MPVSRSRRDVALAWAPAVAWAAGIFLLSAQPGLRFAPDASVDLIVRKAGHMAVFGILALLVGRASDRVGWQPAAAWAIAITVAYAASDELHQGFVADRQASGIDVAIDAIGALLAIAGRFVVRSRGLG